MNIVLVLRLLLSILGHMCKLCLCYIYIYIFECVQNFSTWSTKSDSTNSKNLL